MGLWMREAAERDAIIARTALQKNRPDFSALVEILCARKPAEIVATRDAYQRLFKTRLEDDIAAETVGPEQKLLFALAKARRCPFAHVDERLAKSDAKKLFDARAGRIGVDENTIVRLLAERTLNHLRSCFAHYHSFYGHHFLEALRSKSRNRFEQALRIVVKCIWEEDKYFCKILHESLQGHMDDDAASAIARVLITKSKSDDGDNEADGRRMNSIRNTYLRLYGVSVEHDICANFSGSFRDFLLRLVSTG
eukprot:TRINITY_DN808_c0_g1_i5.p1 TRINITY_DN808_c0_g1~~TRINITY_DN808_c0_g1_i5.p1  ORF type:complete len:252 (+),score=13.75 TRINITY_DN808_c0_g1_i5:732-1487(+)